MPNRPPPLSVSVLLVIFNRLFFLGIPILVLRSIFIIIPLISLYECSFFPGDGSFSGGVRFLLYYIIVYFYPLLGLSIHILVLDSLVLFLIGFVLFISPFP